MIAVKCFEYHFMILVKKKFFNIEIFPVTIKRLNRKLIYFLHSNIKSRLKSN